MRGLQQDMADSKMEQERTQADLDTSHERNEELHRGNEELRQGMRSPMWQEEWYAGQWNCQNSTYSTSLEDPSKGRCTRIL